mgnify:CR=1 FL=1
MTNTDTDPEYEGEMEFVSLDGLDITELDDGEIVVIDMIEEEE